jgi:hypothetical protein
MGTTLDPTKQRHVSGQLLTQSAKSEVVIQERLYEALTRASPHKR